MIIVYPDADPQLKNILDDKLVSSLRQMAEFRIYEGKPESSEEYIKRVKDADGILLGWSIPNEVIAECPNLKIISFTGIGASHFIDLSYTASKGIKVTNTPGYADNAVAEHALSLMLSLAKNINQHHNNLMKGVWDQSNSSVELKGKTIGLIGLGGIGQRMAVLCKALGLKVISWTFHPTPERAEKLGLKFTDLETLLKKSDFVSLHLPFTEQTKNLLGEKELSFMKKEAYLINTSRAEIIDTDALVKHLAAEKIAGAGVDVFDQEPISENHPLMGLSNVVLTPHTGFNTPEATEEIFRIAVENLIQFFSGNIQKTGI